jgi:hypothetical protein
LPAYRPKEAQKQSGRDGLGFKPAKVSGVAIAKRLSGPSNFENLACFQTKIQV